MLNMAVFKHRRPILTMVEAVIFDMDDVVLDSSAIHERAWDEALGRHGASMDMLEKGEVARIFGMRMREICEFLVKRFGLDADPEEIDAERHNTMMEIMAREMEPSDGLMQLLGMLKGKGMRLALATSGVDDYVDLVLDKLNLRSRFDAVVTGDDVEKGKPDPEVFLKAASKLGVLPGQCVVIEDAQKGIQAAHAAGMKAIGYQNLNHPYRQDLSEADIVINSLEEVTWEMVESLAP
jgi:beta-phosphoglucomutase family hydrolase